MDVAYIIMGREAGECTCEWTRMERMSVVRHGRTDALCVGLCELRGQDTNTKLTFWQEVVSVLLPWKKTNTEFRTYNKSINVA